MTKPTKPTVPPAPSRLNPGVDFSNKADAFAAFQTTFADYMDATAEFVDDRADEALAAALGGSLPSITGRAGQFIRVNSAGTAVEFAPVTDPKNRIINGQFRINQRGYVSGAATTGANQYTFDRWRVAVSGQNITVSGGSGDAGRIVTAPSGGMEQVIEGNNIEGGTYVLNWTGTASASVNGASRSKGETFVLPGNTNATILFSGGTVGDVQLELGLIPTPFERLPWGQELALCLRYYEKSFSYGTAPAQNVANNNGAVSFVSQSVNIWEQTVYFSVKKRIAPVITTFSPNAASANWSTNFDAPTASVPNSNEASFNVRAATPAAAGRVYYIHWTADAEI